MKTETLLFIFDWDKPQEHKKMNDEIANCISSGFNIIASPVMDNKIFYWLARHTQNQPSPLDKTFINAIKRGGLK